MVDGITMHPAHGWTDGTLPVNPASPPQAIAPVMISVTAEFCSGKSSFFRRMLEVFGTEVDWPGQSVVGDMLTVIQLDDYRLTNRAECTASSNSASISVTAEVFQSEMCP